MSKRYIKNKAKHRRSPQRPVIEALESRLLFSADLLPNLFQSDLPENAQPDNGKSSSSISSLFNANGLVGQQTANTVVGEPHAQSPPVDVESGDLAEIPRQLLVVDEQIDDYPAFMKQLSDTAVSERNFDVLIINSAENGIDVLTRGLSGGTVYSTVYIVAHGSDSQVQLGKDRLSSATIESNADEIRQWNRGLAVGADILIYGCDVAGSVQGQAMVERLGQLTGADIAASEDLTGSGLSGADWDLEFTVGEVNTRTILSDHIQNSYTGTLDITSGLVSHLRFDSDASDSSVSGIDATLMNGAVIDNNAASNQIGSGKVGLDGVSNTVDLSAHAATVDGLTQGTIAAWIYTDNISGYKRIFSASDSGDSFSNVAITLSADEIEIFINDDDAATVPLLAQTTSAGLTANTWVHVTFTVSATGNKLYVDGVEQSLNYLSGDPSTSVFFDSVSDIDTVRWGNSLSNTSTEENYFDGFIDDARVYDRPLSPADVSALYSYVSGGNIAVDTTTGVVDGSTTDVSSLIASKGSDGYISLREAILAVNNDPSTEWTIILAAGNYEISVDNANDLTGDYDIRNSVAIVGAGMGSTFLDARYIDRVIEVHSGSVLFEALTIQNGDGFAGGSGIDISASADVTLSAVRLFNNSSSGSHGGAILNPGTLTVLDSVFDSNRVVNGSGGAIRSSGSLTIERTTFDSNTASNASGGGAITQGTAGVGSISDSLFINNQVVNGDGGALFASGSMDVTNTTFSQNSTSGASDGGAINITSGSATLRNVTVTGNTTEGDGAVRVTSSGTLDLKNTLIAANVDNKDLRIAGTVNDLGYNLIGNGDGQSGLVDGVNGNQIGDGAVAIDPLLSALADHGGPTQTHALTPFSPAVDAASSTGAPLNDQRGAVRDGSPDIGAYEFNATIPGVPSDLSVRASGQGGFSINHDSGDNGYFQVQSDGSGNSIGALMGGLSGFTVELGFSVSDDNTQTILSYAGTEPQGKDLQIKLGRVSSDGEIEILLNGAANRLNVVDKDFYDLLDGARHHLGFSWDNTSGDWVLYMDGQLVQSGSGFAVGQTLSGDALTGSLVLGQEQNMPNGGFDPAQTFRGTYYDVRVFDTVRSSALIAATYRSDLPVNEPDMIANWQFDQLSSGQGVVDTVYSNVLTLKEVDDNGFTRSYPELSLNVNENSPDETIVGLVGATDSERDALIASFLAADPQLVYDAEVNRFYKPFTGAADQLTANSIATSTLLNGVAGALPSVYSSHENQSIRELISTTGESGVWLSATDEIVSNTWQWHSGERFWQGDAAGYNINNAYTNFLAGQPNLAGSPTDTQYLWMDINGQWHDSMSSQLNTAVIIEWNVDEVLNNTQPLQYEIIDQSVTGAFAIDREDGSITVADGTLLDFEIQPTHELEVRVSDVSGHSTTRTFDVSLVDVAETIATPISVSSGVELNVDGLTDDYLIIDNAVTLPGGQSSLTVEFAFETSSADTLALWSYSSLSDSNADDDTRLVLQNNGVLLFSINGEVTLFNAIDFNSLRDGELHHLAVTWDGVNGNLAVYVDGEKIQTAIDPATNGQVIRNGGRLVIGQDQDYPATVFSQENAFRGTLYDIRLWDEARTAAEIAYNHQHKFSTGSLPSGLVANWQMDSIDSGQQITDIVSGNHLLITQIGQDITAWVNQVGGVSQTGNTLTYVDDNAPEGWASQINSVKLSTLGYTDNYTIKFKLDNTTNFSWTVGLGSVESDVGRLDPEHAIFVDSLSAGSISIRNSGSLTGVYSVNYQAGSEFGFHVNGTTLEYQYDGVTFAIDTIPAETDWYIDSSFFVRTSDMAYNNQDDYSLSHFQIIGENNNSSLVALNSSPLEDLHIHEHATDGSRVGYVRPVAEDLYNDIVLDGQFRKAPDPGVLQAYTGPSVLGDWIVESGDAVLLGSAFAETASGGRGVDLSGATSTPAIIKQTLDTEAGRQYQLTFAMSGNHSSEDIKKMRVSADGQSVDFQHIKNSAWSFSNPQWDYHTFGFTATDTTTEIRLLSLESVVEGPIVSDLQVIAVPAAVQSVLHSDPSLSYNAATGKFYRLETTTEVASVASSKASSALINGVSGQLAIVRSQTENDFLRELTAYSAVMHYLGGTDDTVEDEWNWIDEGEESDRFWNGASGGSAPSGSYANFNGEPDGGNTENRLALRPIDGAWLDLTGAGSQPYIIEWDAAEVLTAFSLSLTDDAGGRFLLDVDTGEVSVADGSQLDYEANVNHTVGIQVTGPAGEVNTTSQQIIVENVIEPTQGLPAAQMVDEDELLVFSVANGNEITIKDTLPETDTVMRVELTVQNGVMNLAQLTGITIVGGSDGSSALLFHGTESDINAALDGLTFIPDPEFSGTVSLDMTTSINVDLSGHYTFDDSNANDDSIGPIVDGSVAGGVFSTVGGSRGSVLSLDGSGAHVELPSDYSQPTDITLSAWVKYNSADLSGSEVITIGDAIGLRVETPGTGAHGFFYNGSTYETLGSGVSLADNQWHHLAFTFDDAADQQVLTIDGKIAAIANHTDSISYASGFDSRIGAHANISVSSVDFNGLIDDVRIFGRSLSMDEIKALSIDKTATSGSLSINVNSVNDQPTFNYPGQLVVLTDSSSDGQNPDTYSYADGSLLVVPFDSNNEAVLVKLNVDGSIDTGFGSNGYSDNSITGAIQSIVVQPDGKILVAGELGGDAVVSRYDASGLIDTTFGSNGYITIGSGGSSNVTDMALQADGKILISGELSSTSLVARLNNDGSLDSSFSGDGIFTLNLGNSFESLESIQIQTDGKIVAAGMTEVIRLNTNGTLDSTFDGNGRLSTGYTISDVLVQSDGKIVTTGSSGGSLLVSRYLSSGLTDTGFNFTGEANWTNTIRTANAAAIVEQADGKLVVGGSFTNNPKDWIAVRFNADGSLDSLFADNGAWVMEGSGSSGELYSINLYQDQGDEKIVLGGYSSNLSGATAATVVRLNSDGLPDATIGSSTLGASVSFTEDGASVVLDHNVQILDAELSAIDNFDGATLRLSRSGGVNIADEYSASSTGTLGVLNEGSVLQVNSTTVGTVTTNSGGILLLTFNANATNARVNEVLQHVAYANTNDAPVSSVDIDWLFSDQNNGSQGSGGVLNISGTTTVDITPVNDSPELDNLTGDGPIYIEGSGSLRIDQSPQVLISDVDSPDFNGGSLTVRFSTGSTSTEDVLSVDSQGSAAGQILLSGSTVSFEGIVIGNASGGSNGTDLVIVLNASANESAVTALTAAISYENINTDNPVAGDRTVNYVVTDGDGGSSIGRVATVSVVAVNDAPLLSTSASIATFVENSTPVNIDQLAAVSDVDSPDFDGATLTVSITTGLSVDDWLRIDYEGGGVGEVAGLADAISYSGVTVATWSGGIGAPLVIEFNANADAAVVQEITNAILFVNHSDTPATNDRGLTFVLTDGDGGDSGAVTKTLRVAAVNDPPRIASSEFTEDFESGASGWTSNTTSADVALSGFLGRFGAGTNSQEVSKTYSLPDGAEEAVLEFDLYRLDSWDAGDEFIIYIDDTEVARVSSLSGSFGAQGNVSWSADPYSLLYANITGAGQHGDALLNVRLLHSDPSGSIKVGFGSTLDGTVSDESWGVDNLSLRSFGYSHSYVENDGAVLFLPPTLMLSDIDNGDMTGATVQITGNYAVAEDILLFTNQNGISGIWNVASGTIDLSGSASKVDYLSAIASIRYQNLSENPSPVDRSVSISVFDGTDRSVVLDTTIKVVAVNDNPVIVNLGSESLIFTEGDSAVVIDQLPGAVVTDVDSADFSGGTLTVAFDSNGINDEDVLAIKHTGIGSGEIGLSGNSLLYEGVTIGVVTGGMNGVDLVVTFNAAATPTAVTRLTQNIQFDNSNLDDPTPGGLSVDFVLTDGDGGSSLVHRVDIDVVSINDAPVISTVASPVTYIEGALPSLLDNGLSVVDPDSTSFAGGSLTASIVIGAQSTDKLTVVNGNTITVSGNSVMVDSGAGAVNIGSVSGGNGTDALVVTFNANATLATVEATAQQLAFQSDTDDPVVLPRSVNILISDSEGGISAPVSIPVTVQAINDAPVLSGIETVALNYVENQGALQITATTVLADIDDTFIESATFTISGGYRALEDQLEYTDTPTITAVRDSVAGTLTLSGSDSRAAYENAISSVTYRNSAENPHTATRTFSLTVSDGQSDSNLLERQLTLTSVNDDPVNIGVIPDSALVFEDVATGIILDSIVLQDSDAANDPVTLVVSSTSGGALSYSSIGSLTASGTDTSSVSLTGTIDHLNTWLSVANGLTYTPVAHLNGNGSDALDLMVRDNGNNGSGNGLDINLGRVVIDIVPVNDEPSGADRFVVIDEDQSHTFAVSDFGFSDSVDNHAFQAIVIDQLPVNGVLSLNTFPVLAGATVAVTDVVTGGFVYTPAPDSNGLNYSSMTFRVQDAGGSNNNGVDTDATANKVTFDVTARSDAPTGQNLTLSALEDIGQIIGISAFGFTDTLDDDRLDSVLVVSLPDNGRLTLNGQDVSPGSQLDADQIMAGGLVYRANTDVFGLNSDSFEFRLVDEGAAGANQSEAVNYLSIDVIGVNDPPDGLDNVINIDEDSVYVVRTADFGFNDSVDLPAAHSLTAVTITEVPESGVLTLDGFAVIPGQVITANAIDAELLVYQPTVDDFDVVSRVIGFRVHDSGGTDNAGIDIDPKSNLINIGVLGVNDPPVLQSQGATLAEGSSVIIDSSMLYALDPDDPEPQDLKLTITALPEVGELRIAGVPISAGDQFTLQSILDQALSYHHDNSETSEDRFTVSLTDGGEDGVAAVAGEFDLSITEVIDPAPVLDNDRLNLKNGQSFNSADGDLLESGFTGLSNNELSVPNVFTVSIETGPQQGSVEIFTDGTFRYVHNGSSVTTDQFAYRVTNEDGIYTIATVTILIEPVVAAATQTAGPSNTTDLPVQSQMPDEEPEEGPVEEQQRETMAPMGAALPEPVNIASHEKDSEEDESVIPVVSESSDENSDQAFPPREDGDWLGVKQHNKAESVIVVGDELSEVAVTTLEIIFEVKAPTIKEVANNPGFLQGLNDVEKEMEYAANSQSVRFQLAEEIAMAASFSASVGVVAWALRSGALFASIMSAGPLWWSIDPSKAKTPPKSAEEYEAERERQLADGKLEKIFENEEQGTRKNKDPV